MSKSSENSNPVFLDLIDFLCRLLTLEDLTKGGTNYKVRAMEVAGS